MNNNKLQLSHIQHYPIGRDNGLRVQYKSREKYPIRKIGSVLSINSLSKPYIQLLIDKDIQSYSLVAVNYEIKPILRPMSDLCKPLEDGSIPMEVILKMFGYDNVERYEDDGLVTYGWDAHICDDWQGYIINWHKRFKWFVSYYDDYDPENEDLNLTGDTEVGNIEVVEYLFAHHFDVYGLIDQNLAIDINTIEQ